MFQIAHARFGKSLSAKQQDSKRQCKPKRQAYRCPDNVRPKSPPLPARLGYFLRCFRF